MNLCRHYTTSRGGSKHMMTEMHEDAARNMKFSAVSSFNAVSSLVTVVLLAGWTCAFLCVMLLCLNRQQR